MKILVISNLFPNKNDPTRGVYNKEQIRALSKLCVLKVIAPLPWLPPFHINKRWNCFLGVPKKEMIEGVEVLHPRYLIIPKFARSLYGFFFYAFLLKKVKRVYDSFKFDLMYVPWAYPDGFGSFLISKKIKIPLVIGVLGSDINLYTQSYIRRKMIIHSLSNCNRVIAVSIALKEKIVKLGVPKEKVKVITNGVYTNRFKPMEMTACREHLGLPIDKKIVLYIGNFYPVKGVDHLIEAFARINVLNDDVNLILLGGGDLKEKYIKKIKLLQLENKVKFISKKHHEEIPFWLNASDVFCLPSLNEGCPNIVLEALACGKPVVATRVGGLPELINAENYGFLVNPGDSTELAEAIREALDKEWNTEFIRSRVLGYTWDENAKEICNELKSAICYDKKE